MESCRELGPAGASGHWRAVVTTTIAVRFHLKSRLHYTERARRKPAVSSSSPMLRSVECRCETLRVCGWILAVLLGSCLQVFAQAGPSAAPSADQIEQLAAQQRW